MIEILSPVGNREMLIAAVRSGADAVYLGAGDFNARRNADNFTHSQLLEVVEYCHKYFVKVYLTLNTLIYNEEAQRVADLVSYAASINIDGIICADLGAAKIVKEIAPNMPLHASTQMTVHTKEALPMLKKLGFSRVVPSREMSKAELIDFVKEANNLNIEVEVFVHGALCMSMSGQCLMSAYFGGRSGNRGLCAGPCRLPFRCNEKPDYALSLKDMSYVGYIKELENMGVKSIKIEGRMKTPEYVACATKVCCDMKENGQVDEKYIKLLNGVFSRSGFTSGYYNGELSKDMFGIRTEEQLDLSLNIQNEIHEFYRNERSANPINFKFTANLLSPIKLIANDGFFTVEVQGEMPQPAINKPISYQFLLNAFSKLGGTPYKLNSLEVEISDGLSVPMSQLNNLRRTAVENLNLKHTAFSGCDLGTANLPKPLTRPKNTPKIYCRFENVSSMPENIDGVDVLLLPLEKANEYGGNLPVYAHLPRGLSNLKNLEELILSKMPNFYGLVVENLATLQVAIKNDIPYIIGSGFNVLNALSEEVLINLNCQAVILSYETKIKEVDYFKGNIGITAYGKTPLMLVRNCPIKSSIGCKECKNIIIDRKGIEFPVYCRAGYSEIYNSRPIVLSDRINELEKFNFIVLNFVDETKEQAQSVINAYKNGTMAQGEYTRGLYYKGVI